MAIVPDPGRLSWDRRSFLWSVAGLGISSRLLRSEKPSDATYRLRTPEGEVRMSVRYFAAPATNNFMFRDGLTARPFCLSADGEQNRNCLERFVGSMAIASYQFRSRRTPRVPLNLRERVVTIDQDDRMSPRPPFEREMAVERDVVGDIQAFGYTPDGADAGSLAVWRLLRQNLYLNDQTSAFLILHWKHTLKFISLVDVIPGEGTEFIH
jgi:hypothetical protein